MNTEEKSPNYRIGAVSRLTGIPPDTLRVWERRYDLVQPVRSEGGGRLYSQEDVTRLTLIKRLVDSGHAISTIAGLTVEQLQERIAETRIADQSVKLEQPIRLVLLGATLPKRLQGELEADVGRAVELAGAFEGPEEFLDSAEDLDAHVLVIELPVLDSTSAADVRELGRRCGAVRTLVVYGFASRESVAHLERQGIMPLRSPVTWEEIRALLGVADQPAVQQQATVPDGALLEAPPERLYEDRQLAVAATTSTSIRCECPRHLADLILSLSHFEAYSARCENKNRDDAALHAYLHVATAQARLLMEQALRKVAEVEGIDLSGPSPEGT
jgi:DNA-binding transcriptional MerR regulator